MLESCRQSNFAKTLGLELMSLVVQT